MKPNSNPMEPKARLLADPDITEAIQTTRAALAEYGAFVLEQDDRIFPSHAVVRLQQEIAASSDVSAITEKMALLRELDSKAAVAAAENVMKQAIDIFEPGRSALVDLLETAASKLESWGADALASEKEFFGQWGVSPAPQTEIRSRYTRALAEITALLNTWSVRPTALPNADGTPLKSFFGIGLLA